MRKAIAVFGLLGLLGNAVAVIAAPRSDGGDPALRQMQAQMQKLAAERTALQKQNSELTAKIGELEKRTAELEAEGKQRGGELSKTQSANEQLRSRVERDSERYKDLSEHNGRISATLRDAQADIQLLQSAVQERDRWIADCQAKNDSMYQANTELLAAYRDKDTWDALRQSEPLTGVGAIEVENAVQEYRFRLEDLRTVKFEPAVGAGQPPQ
ncbi:MAG TPA: hypothetical protein VIR60_05170 [Gammaproteobacteria bacterium]